MMTSRPVANLMLAVVIPVAAYVPLNLGNSNLLRRGTISNDVAMLTWAAIWLGSVAVGGWFARRVVGERHVLLALYSVAMMALLGYIGLATGLFLYGGGP